MREIKFRVWDKINKEMLVYGKKQIGWMCPIDRPSFPCEAHVFALTNNPEGYSELQWCLDHPDAFSVMQFTGLRDKVGREIYEGDIIESRYESIGAGEIVSRNPVEWDAPCFYLGGKQMQHNPLGVIARAWQKEQEIIGNVYEGSRES